MNLYIKNRKYFCKYRHYGCPYKYCPWYQKGVSIDKKDFLKYQTERESQHWFHLPLDSKDAQFCLAYMDI